MDSIYSINPMQYLEPRLLNDQKVSQNPQELAKDFESMFLMQLAKQAFKNSFWGSGDRLEVKMYQDYFIEQLAGELTDQDAFGLRDLIQKRIEKNQAGQAKNAQQ